ncbi:unnamed protein product [Peronospora belbahrii]|uniref:GTP-binding protein Parf n=1 Tax=Peronospora belbahrii TaxID=622444 RepID=A0ABN8D4Q7_9STRA|nr:unnamed protein product [Peronospora belbahrii]
MDKAIRRRVRGSVTYKMKLLIRGAKGTGKTSLFQRLQGDPIPETHEATPQLQSATIKWNFSQNLEENVKCEVWDVVDQGFVPVKVRKGDEEVAIRQEDANAVGQGGLQSQENVLGEVIVSAEHDITIQNKANAMAVVDASTVNVYHEAHGVIFLLDITKWDTLEYVKQQLDNVPVDVPTLVLGNFRDQGTQRKVFKEDIEEMLYGSSIRPQQQQWRRPTELLYFECSLLNCFGLKSLHQYFGIPFLKLKLVTIRNQMHIVEGDLIRVNRDVQATITEQHYAEYVEHIKTTKSDIRTGRRSFEKNSTPPGVSSNNSAMLASNKIDQEKPATLQYSTENGSKENSAKMPPKATTSETSPHEVTGSQDTTNLPSRISSVVVGTVPSLRLQQKEREIASVTGHPTDTNFVKTGDTHSLLCETSIESVSVNSASPSRSRKALIDDVIRLEDFQAPRSRFGDLEHFYSEDDTDQDIGDNDVDVAVAPANGLMKASTIHPYHKQCFLDSDSSDSAEELTNMQRRRKDKTPYKNGSRYSATKPSKNATSNPTRPHLSAMRPSSQYSRLTDAPSMDRIAPCPARLQPSSPMKGFQSVPREEPSQQRPSLCFTSDTALTLAHPAAPPPAPASASLSLHMGPRIKSENNSAAPHSEMLVSVLQDEGKLKNSFSHVRKLSLQEQ